MEFKQHFEYYGNNRDIDNKKLDMEIYIRQSKLLFVALIRFMIQF